MYAIPAIIRRQSLVLKGTLSKDATVARLRQILIWIVVIDVLLCGVLLLKLLFVYQRPKPVIAASGNYGAIAAPVSIATTTQNFVAQINSFDPVLKPIIVGQIRRVGLSVPGRIITLDGDNMQVFEYSDHDTATKEASSLVQKYTPSSNGTTWKNTHIYVSNQLLVFYKGNNKSILKALEAISKKG